MLSVLLVQSALAANPLWNLAPFGVGVYLHDRPVRGVAYSTTQAAGIAAAVTGQVLLAKAAEAQDDAAIGRWQDVTTVGVAAAAASYVTAMIDAGRLHELEAEKAKAAVQAWDAALLAAREENR